VRVFKTFFCETETFVKNEQKNFLFLFNFTRSFYDIFRFFKSFSVFKVQNVHNLK